jgi:hypothetical protein
VLNEYKYIYDKKYINQRMNIFCATFNQNGNYITADVLNHIYSLLNAPLPELLVLSFQETKYGFEYYWTGTGIERNYVIIRKIRLNGIGNVGIRGLGLYILVRKNFKKMVEYKSENWVRFNHQYFGKGAVSIHITIGNRKFLFINTHLPYNDSWEGGGINERIDSLNVLYTYLIANESYHHLFIMGDFNFRIHLKQQECVSPTLMLSDPSLYELYLRNKNWRLLHHNDEFFILNYLYGNYLNTLDMNDCFGTEFGFHLETLLLPFYNHIIDKPLFPPTYKLHLDRQSCIITIENTDKLDIETHYNRWNTDRRPSWCDRILYVPHPNLTRKKYECADNITINNSDHLLVWSVFELSELLI